MMYTENMVAGRPATEGLCLARVGRGGKQQVDFEFPKCQKCKTGDLVPLSDFGSQGAPIHFKAWVCTNPACGFNIKIRNGDVYLNEPINAGQLQPARMSRM